MFAVPDLTTKPWGDKPRPTFVAVHLLLCLLADDRGEVVGAVPTLAAILDVEARTIQICIKQLREDGRLSGDSGRLQLCPVGDRPRVADLPPGDPCDPTIARGDPRIVSAIPRSFQRSHDRLSDPERHQVAALTERSDAKRSDASLEIWIDRILEKAASYVPVSNDGRRLPGRAVHAQSDATRGLVRLLLASMSEPHAGASVLEYVERYIVVCQQDVHQRRFWSGQMFSLAVSPGRRKSPWAALTSVVDRGQLLAPSRHVEAAPLPDRYGGGEVEL